MIPNPHHHQTRNVLLCKGLSFAASQYLALRIGLCTHHDFGMHVNIWRAFVHAHTPHMQPPNDVM